MSTLHQHMQHASRRNMKECAHEVTKPRRMLGNRQPGRTSTCPPAPSNLPTKTETAMEPCGAETRRVRAVALAPCRSMAGTAMIPPPASKNATPAVPSPPLTAARTCSRYSAPAACGALGSGHTQPAMVRCLLQPSQQPGCPAYTSMARRLADPVATA